MNWAALAGSLGAVIALAAVAWALKLGPAPRIADADEAKRLAREAHTGFVPADAAVDRDGRAAIVAGADGRIALLRVHGARVAARLLPRAEARAEGGILKIASGERMFGDVAIALGAAEAARWARRLGERDDA